MTKEALSIEDTLKLALDALENHTAIKHPQQIEYRDKAITAIKEALAQPDPYKQGYADAMNWKVQNHLEHLPVAWKLMPREATREMLEAMDECSMEGYDEHLYAGHAASVYMAAWDEAPTPPQRTAAEGEDTRRAWVGLTDEEINDIVYSHDELNGSWELIDMVEAKLKEKNT